MKPWAYVVLLMALVGILAGIYGMGRSAGKASQKKVDAALIEKKNSALRGASQALSLAAITFREISASTEDSRLQGELVKQEAARANIEVSRQRDDLAKKLEQINRDNQSCEQAKLRVCGAALR